MGQSESVDGKGTMRDGVHRLRNRLWCSTVGEGWAMGLPFNTARAWERRSFGYSTLRYGGERAPG